jgi:hypothetical protein
MTMFCCCLLSYLDRIQLRQRHREPDEPANKESEYCDDDVLLSLFALLFRSDTAASET